jgi:hypothetical protein
MNGPTAAVLITLILGLAYAIPAWRAAGRIGRF